MSDRSLVQRKRLVRLAGLIMTQGEPLGVGLKKGCWAGVAIDLARQDACKATDYYGMPMQEIKQAIKLNNRTRPAVRNAMMAGLTLAKAVS